MKVVEYFAGVQKELTPRVFLVCSKVNQNVRDQGACNVNTRVTAVLGYKTASFVTHGQEVVLLYSENRQEVVLLYSGNRQEVVLLYPGNRQEVCLPFSSRWAGSLCRGTGSPLLSPPAAGSL